MVFRLIYFILLFSLVPLGNALAKPSSSISVTMEWLDTPVVGQVNEFKVRIYTSMTAEKVQLKFAMPERVELLNADPVSSYDVPASRQLELQFKVMLPENSQGGISAVVSQGQKGKAYFSASYELPLSNESVNSLKARDLDQPAYKRTERNGLGIREYQLSK